MEADVIPRSEGTFLQFRMRSSSVCVFLCETYLFYCIVLYCYVSTLAPLYVRPLIVYHPLSSSSSFAYRWASPRRLSWACTSIPCSLSLYMYICICIFMYISPTSFSIAWYIYHPYKHPKHPKHPKHHTNQGTSFYISINHTLYTIHIHILIWQQVRRRGGARIRWRQMSSLDQRGHFWYYLFADFYLYVCSYVWHIYSILLYCYVSTLAPLYVRPLNQPTKITWLNDNRRLDRGCATRHSRLLQEAHQQATGPENARYSLNKERDSQGNSW